MDPVITAKAVWTVAQSKPGRFILAGAASIIAGFLMLPMILFTHIPATDPGGYAMYRQAAQKLASETGLGVNWQYFVVIDAVRRRQDFSNVKESEIIPFFKSVFYEKQKIRLHEYVPCKDKSGKKKICTKTVIREVWRTRSLETALNKIGFSAKQKEQVHQMLSVDLNELIPKNEGSGFTPNENRLAWPVPGATRISSPFGMRRDPLSGKPAFHTGIDIAAALGTPVVAAESGWVRIAAFSDTAGNWIVIDRGGEETRYEHLELSFVQADDEISRGQVIGSVGETGQATGSHLHFEVRENGKPVNPMMMYE